MTTRTAILSVLALAALCCMVWGQVEPVQIAPPMPYRLVTNAAGEVHLELGPYMPTHPQLPMQPVLTTNWGVFDLSKYDLGRRSDGVVVWREAK